MEYQVTVSMTVGRHRHGQTDRPVTAEKPTACNTDRHAEIHRHRQRDRQRVSQTHGFSSLQQLRMSVLCGIFIINMQIA